MEQIELGGRTLNIAPANLKSIKRWLKAQKEVIPGSYEWMDEVSVFIHATLAIEQPDLTQEWLEEHLNEVRIAEVIKKIYGAGNIKSGEEQRPQNP